MNDLIIDGKNVTASKRKTAAERMGFIVKVYALLGLSVLTAGVTAAVGVSMGMTCKYYWPLVIAELVAVIIAMQVRKVPVVNLIALFCFTALTGLTLAPLLVLLIKAGMGNIIWMAAGVTASIFASLSAYVLITGRDFMYMRGFLFSSLCILLVATLLQLIFPVPMMGFVLACISALLFSGFILYDTSSLIHRFNDDDYIEAAIEIYLDVLNMFVDVLRILMEIASHS